MSSSIVRFLIYLIFSYCLYQLFFFIDLIFGLPEIDDGTFQDYVYASLQYLFLPFIIVKNTFVSFKNFEFIMLVPLGAIGLIYWCTLSLWWKAPSIATAWLLSLTGLFAGPGVYLIAGHFHQPGLMSCLWAAAIVILIFPLIEIGNYFQKKYWPDNKLCNRIRATLKWLCFKT